MKKNLYLIDFNAFTFLSRLDQDKKYIYYKLHIYVSCFKEKPQKLENGNKFMSRNLKFDATQH